MWHQWNEAHTHKQRVFLLLRVIFFFFFFCFVQHRTWSERSHTDTHTHILCRNEITTILKCSGIETRPPYWIFVWLFVLSSFLFHHWLCCKNDWICSIQIAMNYSAMKMSCVSMSVQEIALLTWAHTYFHCDGSPTLMSFWYLGKLSRYYYFTLVSLWRSICHQHAKLQWTEKKGKEKKIMTFHRRIVYLVLLALKSGALGQN